MMVFYDPKLPRRSSVAVTLAMAVRTISFSSVISFQILGAGVASAEDGQPVDMESHGEIRLQEVGPLTYDAIYTRLGGDRAYATVKIFWAGAPPEGQTLYEGVIDKPPVRVEATKKGICFSAQGCEPRGENCRWLYAGFAYSENSKDFIEQEEATFVCDYDKMKVEVPQSSPTE